MYKVFQLTNELRAGGPETLAPLLCAAEATVLWTPACQLLRQAYESDRSIISPKGLMGLIENDEIPIQIMGREEWLTDKTFRKHHAWDAAKIWDKNYDEVICRIAHEDISKPLQQRRVIISAPERGWEKAEECLSDNENEILREKLYRLYQSKTLPPGILERASINETHGVDPAITILRDIFNHIEAVKECDASGSALDLKYYQFLYDLQAAGLKLDFTEVHVPDDHDDSTKVSEALSLLKGITPLTNEKRLKKFLCSEERKKLHTLLYSNHTLPIRREILRRIIDAQDNRTYFKKIIPGLTFEDPIEFSLTLGSLVTLFLTSILTTPFNWGWIVLATKFVSEELRRQGLIPAVFDSKGSGTSPIFFLCYGTTRPNNKQIKEIRLKILNEIEKQT